MPADSQPTDSADLAAISRVHINSRAVAAMLGALAHLAYLDESNAAIHCAAVRYSPLTFRLAESLAEVDEGLCDELVTRVLYHKGKYAEDAGR